MDKTQAGKKRFRRILVIVILFALFAVAWAASELGQANKSAANTSQTSQNFEMTSAEIFNISKPSGPQITCDRNTQNSINKMIQQRNTMDSEYQKLTNNALLEIEKNGATTPATAAAIMKSAEEYQKITNQIVQLCKQCNFITRSKGERALGESRMASAKLAAYGANSDNADAAQAAAEKLNAARQEYVQEVIANNELTAEDKAKIQANIMPQAQALLTQAQGLVESTGKALQELQAQIKPSVGGLTGCMSSGGSQGAAGGNDASSLIAPMTSLLSLAKGLATNAGSLLEDVTLLIK